MYIGSVTFLCGHVVWRMVGRLHFARSVQTAVWVYNIIVLKPVVCGNGRCWRIVQYQHSLVSHWGHGGTSTPVEFDLHLPGQCPESPYAPSSPTHEGGDHTCLKKNSLYYYIHIFNDQHVHTGLWRPLGLIQVMRE